MTQKGKRSPRKFYECMLIRPTRCSGVNALFSPFQIVTALTIDRKNNQSCPDSIQTQPLVCFYLSNPSKAHQPISGPLNSKKLQPPANVTFVTLFLFFIPAHTQLLALQGPFLELEGISRSQTCSIGKKTNETRGGISSRTQIGGVVRSNAGPEGGHFRGPFRPTWRLLSGLLSRGKRTRERENGGLASSSFSLPLLRCQRRLALQSFVVPCLGKCCVLAFPLCCLLSMAHASHDRHTDFDLELPHRFRLCFFSCVCAAWF